MYIYTGEPRRARRAQTSPVDRRAHQSLEEPKRAQQSPRESPRVISLLINNKPMDARRHQGPRVSAA